MRKIIYKYGNVAAVPITSLGSSKFLYWTPGSPNQPIGYGPAAIANDGAMYYLTGNSNVGWIHNIHDDTYHLLGATGSIFIVYSDPSINEYGEIENYGTATGIHDGDVMPYGGSIPITDVGQTLLSLSAYGEETEETTGGSLIDWNAPNAEIERQIKELHETWDVSEHQGSVEANGTYVLAGPIEYNDADPTQGPPGSVG